MSVVTSSSYQTLISGHASETMQQSFAFLEYYRIVVVRNKSTVELKREDVDAL